jgi:hypothetical protein
VKNLLSNLAVLQHVWDGHSLRQGQGKALSVAFDLDLGFDHVERALLPAAFDLDLDVDREGHGFSS